MNLIELISLKRHMIVSNISYQQHREFNEVRSISGNVIARERYINGNALSFDCSIDKHEEYEERILKGETLVLADTSNSNIRIEVIGPTFISSFASTHSIKFNLSFDKIGVYINKEK